MVLSILSRARPLVESRTHTKILPTGTYVRSYAHTNKSSCTHSLPPVCSVVVESFASFVRMTGTREKCAEDMRASGIASVSRQFCRRRKSKRLPLLLHRDFNTAPSVARKSRQMRRHWPAARSIFSVPGNTQLLSRDRLLCTQSTEVFRPKLRI